MGVPDVEGGFGGLAGAFFGRIGRELRPRRDILREQFTVIREFVQNFAGAVVAMVPAGALYRLGIGNDFLLELLQDQSRRGLAEPAIAIGQWCAFRRLGLLVLEAAVAGQDGVSRVGNF